MMICFSVVAVLFMRAFRRDWDQRANGTQRGVSAVVSPWTRNGNNLPPNFRLLQISVIIVKTTVISVEIFYAKAKPNTRSILTVRELWTWSLSLEWERHVEAAYWTLYTRPPLSIPLRKRQWDFMINLFVKGEMFTQQIFSSFFASSFDVVLLSVMARQKGNTDKTNEN